MTEYYTNSVKVSGRPNYTECNLDFLNMSLYWVLVFSQMSSVVCIDFHRAGLLNSPVSQQRSTHPAHSSPQLIFCGSDGGVWLVQRLLFYPDGRVDGLTASLLPTQDVLTELRRVHSSAARCHHGETFLEQSLQHLSKNNEANVNEDNYLPLFTIYLFTLAF